MKKEARTICIAHLDTERGIVDAAVKMAEVVCTDVLWPVVECTPKERRADLFERFLSALTGAACAELGPERAKQALDAARLAIEDVQRERSHAH